MCMVEFTCTFLITLYTVISKLVRYKPVIGMLSKVHLMATPLCKPLTDCAINNIITTAKYSIIFRRHHTP